MNLPQPDLLKKLGGWFYEYTRRHRELTACVSLVVAYLVVCEFLGLPFLYLALAVVGLILLFIVLKYPLAAYLGYIFLINLFPYSYIGTRAFTLAKIGGVLLLAITLAHTAIRTSEFKERIKQAFDKKGRMLLILVLAGAISTALSRDPQFAFFEQHFQFVLIFVLTRIYIKNEKHLWMVLMIILLARGIDGIQGAYQFLVLPAVTRIGGSFIDPNENACYSLLALPIALYLINYKKAIWFRLGVLALGFFTFVAVVVSSSRAGFVTLAVLCFLFMLIPTIRLRNRLIALLLVVLIIFSFTPLDYWSRIESINTLFEEDSERSLLIRKRQVYTSVRFFLERPIVGIGYIQYRSRPEELLGGYVIKRWRLGAHSTFLKVLVEFGLIGLIPFLILLFMTFRAGIRAIVLAKSNGYRKLLLLATATTLSFTSLIIFGAMLGAYTKFLFMYLALPMVSYDLVTNKLRLNQEKSEATLTDAEPT